MPLVRVKEKHQVTIPAEVRKKLNLKVGDYLEVETRGDVILLRPKAVVVVDRAKEKAWKRLHALLDQVHHKIGPVGPGPPQDRPGPRRGSGAGCSGSDSSP